MFLQRDIRYSFESGWRCVSEISVCVLRRLDDGYGAGSPDVVAFASFTLGVQLIVLGIELEGDVALFFIGHHQIQVLATSAFHESGFARIESQNIHRNATVWMRDSTA
jgi:hypothetical protein